VPLWLLRFNFLSLLNLPQILEEFGSTRNYFEGKYLGERYVQEVKNSRDRCPPTNLHFNLLKKLHEAKALSVIVGNRESEKIVSDLERKKKEISGNIKVYKDRDAAVLAFFSRKPVSILKTGNDEYGILFYQGRNMVKLVKIEHDVVAIDVVNGLRYWTWRITDVTHKLVDVEIGDFAVILPKTGETDPRNREYTLVSKEWSPDMLAHYEFSNTGTQVAKSEIYSI
jgi:hypothetical protein